MLYTYQDFLSEILHQGNLDGEDKPLSFPELTQKRFVKYAKKLCIDYYTYLDLTYTDTHRYKYTVKEKLIFIETKDADGNVVYASTMLYQVVGHIKQKKADRFVKYVQAAIPALAFMISIITMTCHTK